MNNLDNLGSYDNVESVQGNELSRVELEKYCGSKMESAKSNADFCEEEIFVRGGYKEPIKICEIGGGNGKLLYSLEKKGILSRGINYEVSKSRCVLAEKFAEMLSCHRVENINLNFLEDNTREQEFDCIIMVDIVWQLVAPLYDSAESEMVQWLRRALKTAGYLFIEIVDYSDIMKRIEKEGALQTWAELPKEDPFQYSLNKWSVDRDSNLVVEKNFIGRKNNLRDCFRNVIHPCTQETVSETLTQKGFDVKVYPYTDVSDASLPEYERNNTFRILAQKK